MSTTLSGVTMGVSDGGTGAISESNENLLACLGYCTLGTAGQVYSFSDPDDAATTLGDGPLARAVVNHLLYTGKTPVLAVPATSDVVGSLTSPFAQTGTGPAVTSTSAPNDAYQLKVKITKGGTVGVAEFQYSLDGGDVWSPVVLTASTYPIPNTNVTAAFAAGTYVLNEVYSTTCVAPGYSTTNFGTAFDVLTASTYSPSLLHVVGVPASHTAAATWAVAVQTKVEAAATTKYKWMRAFVEVSDSADADLISAFASVVAPRVIACAGFEELLDPASLRIYKRPSAWPAVARAAKVKVQRHLGAVADGGLDGIISLHRDERATEALNAQRFLVLKTLAGGVPGFFVEQPNSMAASGSDFASLHNGRVIDKACYYGYLAALPFTNEDWDLGADGRISEDSARAIESEVQQKIANALLSGGNATAVQVVVNRTDDVLATGRVRMKLRVKPKAYSKFIEVDVGLTKNLAQAA